MRWLGRLFVLQGLVLVLWLAGIGWYLSTPDQPPAKSDLIVILGGGTGDRLATGAALMQQGYGQWVLVTGYRMEDAVLQQWQGSWRAAYLQQKGVPAGAIMLEPSVASTYEESQVVLALMQQHGLSRALIVSDPPHLRRIHSIFSATFAGQPQQFITVAAATDWWDRWLWWKNPGALGFVLTETVKTVFYWFRY